MSARHRRGALLAIVLMGLAYATVIQSFSWNQTSHFDLVEALDHGTTHIDSFIAAPGRPGHFDTGDKALYHGHWYPARAPGLAMLSLPYYKAIDALGAHALARTMAAQSGDDEIIWMVGLWANVLPGLLLALLVWRVGDRFEPGYGAAAAVAVGLGTLLLPLSTLLFSHVLGALLAFAAFAVLLRERDGPGRPALLLAAGLLVGVAVTTEYPTLFAGLVLGLYVLWAPGSPLRDVAATVRRGGAYALGVLVGVIPLGLYNHAAFGSFTHVAYHDIPHNQAGFFGINTPSLAGAYALLVDSRGLLTLSPVLVAALVGVVVMHRRGNRAEAYTIGGIFLVYLIYNSGYFLPFGGGVPGPRFLTTTLPFLAVALAVALRRFPGPTIALAGASAATYAIATLTHPLTGYETEVVEWTRLARQGAFQPTVMSALGLGRGWLAPLPFVALAGLAVIVVATVTPRARLTGRSAAWGVVAIVAWAVLAAWAPRALGADHAGLQTIVDAGDSTALRTHVCPSVYPPICRPYSAHPLATMAVISGAAGLVALGLAWLGWGMGRTAAPRGGRAGTQA